MMVVLQAKSGRLVRVPRAQNLDFQEEFDNIINDPNVPEADTGFTPDVYI
jgi:hypothetical protein